MECEHDLSLSQSSSSSSWMKNDVESEEKILETRNSLSKKFWKYFQNNFQKKIYAKQW